MVRMIDVHIYLTAQELISIILQFRNFILVTTWKFLIDVNTKNLYAVAYDYVFLYSNSMGIPHVPV